jgi:hypothetical protein
MAASTITRDVWTNDTGTAANPNGDGTILQNTVLQNHIYARVDQMFAGAGSYTTFELGGLLKADGFGTHTFSAAGTGVNAINIRNTTADTGNFSQLSLGTDTSAIAGFLSALSSTFTTASPHVANGVTLGSLNAGGLSIAATDAAGDIRFYSGGASERMRVYSSGGVAVGTISDPGAGKLSALGLTVGSIGTGSDLTTISGQTINISGGDYGAFQNGPALLLGRNTNVTGPVASTIGLTAYNNTPYFVWPDVSGILRIGGVGTGPVGDTSGTVIGTQTSQRHTKTIRGRFTDRARALDLICETPLWDFVYANGAYSGTEFVGIVAEDSPAFAMDEGRSFNPVSTCGYLIAAVQELAAKCAALEARP